MARPCKGVNILQDRSLPKEEARARAKGEKMLRGASGKLKPPPYLSDTQKKIFRYIVTELKASGILGNLDVYILAQCSIAIDRLQAIEQMVNNDTSLLFDTKLMGTRKKYADDLYRCCNELSLSPQSRAKVVNLNIKEREANADPVLQLLRGGQK